MLVGRRPLGLPPKWAPWMAGGVADAKGGNVVASTLATRSKDFMANPPESASSYVHPDCPPHRTSRVSGRRHQHRIHTLRLPYLRPDCAYCVDDDEYSNQQCPAICREMTGGRRSYRYAINLSLKYLIAPARVRSWNRRWRAGLNSWVCDVSRSLNYTVMSTGISSMRRHTDTGSVIRTPNPAPFSPST